MEGLVCAADTDKVATKLGCCTASDLKARAFGDGEPVPI